MPLIFTGIFWMPRGWYCIVLALIRRKRDWREAMVTWEVYLWPKLFPPVDKSVGNWHVYVQGEALGLRKPTQNRRKTDAIYSRRRNIYAREGRGIP